MNLLDDDEPVAVTPVGRVDTGLNPYQVYIVHGTGTVRLDHRTAVAAVTGEALSLGPPLGKSVLSGGAAYLYRAKDIQLLLTRDELGRLIRRDLHASEYLKLRQRFGTFFEIEESFYDESTGTALQATKLPLVRR